MNRLLDALKEGGWGMYPLGATLFVALSVVVERALWFRRSAFDAEELLDLIEERVSSRDLGAAVTQCTLIAAPVARVILAGLMQFDRGASMVTAALEQAVAREAPRAERRVAWLATLAQVAGLLGLFGTFSAMMFAHSGYRGRDRCGGSNLTLDPARMAELLACDTSSALRCTQLGLLVALVSVTSYALLRYAVRARERELDAAAARIVALADTHRALLEPGVPYR